MATTTMTTIDALRAAGLLDDDDAGGFVRQGHFVYESGDHGDTWLGLGMLFADPRRLRRTAVRLAEGVRTWAPEVVCGPVVGGALVGQWVAHELGAAFVYAEPRPGTGEGARYVVPGEVRSVLRGARVVVVDDVVNAGAAARACIREIDAVGGSVIGVAALIARASGWLDVWAKGGGTVNVLVRMGWNTWPASACPFCRSGVPVESP